MVIEQMVEIPANHQLLFQVPPEIPAGRARITLTPEGTAAQKIVRPLRSLRGISKGLDTMEAYFERKRADKALEDPGEKYASRKE
jgi:hypothetical protein